MASRPGPPASVADLQPVVPPRRPVSRTAFVEALHALFALAEAARRLAMPTLPAILRLSLRGFK